MPRVKGGKATRKRHKRVLKEAKGYEHARSRSYRKAVETLNRAREQAYSGRKQKKRQFRRLWIQRINAACRERGLTYSRFIHALSGAGVELDRKALAELAYSDPAAFNELAELVRGESG